MHPRAKVKSYKAMKAYGNRYRICQHSSDSKGYVIYNFALLNISKHEDNRVLKEIGFVGELCCIYKFEYGDRSQPIILTQEKWVHSIWIGARKTMIRDIDGFLLVNFRQ
jgi:hypothetical protein